jgi:hypothetical protein
MLTLLFERQHRVLLARVSGVLSSEDFEAHDRAVLTFLGREGAVRGLYDFTAVEAVAVPASKVVQRGQTPPIIPEMRVVVAPRRTGEEFAQAIREYQRLAGYREPLIVPTMTEAYALLGLDDPVFEAVTES